VSAARAAVAALLVLLALVVQVSLLPHLAWHGVVPDLVLLVVVAAGLARGPQFAMVVGFAAGALVDLAPTADHTAGRWALALTVVGYVVGRVRPEAGQGALGVLGTVAGAAFVGGSVFALTGLLLGDSAAGVGAVLGALGISVLWDVLLTPLVLPPLLALFRRLEPAHAF